MKRPKCIKCDIALVHMGFNYYGHPIIAKWRMPMDGYLPEHYEKEMCPLAGITKKYPPK